MEITPIPFPLHAVGNPASRRPAHSGLSRSLAIARGGIEAFWRALVVHARRRPKLLVLVESSPLGDRRFVSVVQFEQQRFLVGSSPSSVTLLARLPDACAISDEVAASAAGGESQ